MSQITPLIKFNQIDVIEIYEMETENVVFLHVFTFSCHHY